MPQDARNLEDKGEKSTANSGQNDSSKGRSMRSGQAAPAASTPTARLTQAHAQVSSPWTTRPRGPRPLGEGQRPRGGQR